VCVYVSVYILYCGIPKKQGKENNEIQERRIMISQTRYNVRLMQLETNAIKHCNIT
jgi:hypothetical protein